MINNISWASYFYAITFITVMYYIVILTKFYSLELQEKFGINKSYPSSKESHDQIENSNSSSIEAPSNIEKNLFSTSQDLIGELHDLIQEALFKKLQKGDVIKALQTHLVGYTQLRGTAFEVAVNNFISVETQIHCSINLSEEELKLIWNIGDGAF